MKLRQLFIVINGNNKELFSKESTKIILSKEINNFTDYDSTFLQTDFFSLEDLIKSENIIQKQFRPINEIIIINNNIDLNMISYQYDYQYIKNNYSILSNLFYFINLIIKDLDKNIKFVLSFEKSSHYKIHTNIFNESIISYLEILKKDLDASHSLSIKKLN